MVCSSDGPRTDDDTARTTVVGRLESSPCPRQIPTVRTIVAESASSSTTEGIRVRVQSQYLPEQSEPTSDRYVFAYTITISNESTRTAQLRTRHWVITDARGSVEEVRGDGVVGEQ